MPEEKKTEDQLRHDIRREFSYSEDRQKDLIDKVLELKKDRYTATQQKNKAIDDLEEAKKAGNPNGEQESNDKQETNKSDYSLTDIRVLSNVKHDDDVETIVNFAKANNISIKEAKKHKDIQFILKGREEERKTAEAANTGGSKRGTTKVSDEQTLNDFDKGIVSEKDEDITSLVKARMAQKKSVSKRAQE